MVINSQSRWTARLVTLVLWALAAASLAWWGLRLWGGASSTSVGTTPSVVAPTAAADPAAVARLLAGPMQAADVDVLMHLAQTELWLAGLESGGAAA